MTTDYESKIVNVISQNVLYDRTRSKEKRVLWQDDRIPSLVATLQAFPGQLDVIGTQEVYKSAHQHNGEVLAAACGYSPGFWVEHNWPIEGTKKGRKNEYVGLFGAQVDHVDSIELGDNRLAAITDIAGVAFVTLHLRSGRQARHGRQEQAQALCEALDPYDNAVVFGDFNEPPIRYIALARREFARARFRSVFPLTGQQYPVTCPTPPYIEIMSGGRNPIEKRVVRRCWSIDDILVRGDRIQVLAAGVLERVVVTNKEIDKQYPDTVPREGSDHEGIWATLEIADI